MAGRSERTMKRGGERERNGEMKDGRRGRQRPSEGERDKRCKVEERVAERVSEGVGEREGERDDSKAEKKRGRRRRGERPCTVRGDRWHIIYITLT